MGQNIMGDPININNLSDEETERLALFIEECGEAIQAACKVLRHGYQSFDPTVPKAKRITNRGALAEEMGHVRAAMILLCCNDIHKARVHESADKKLTSVRQWLHYSHIFPDLSSPASGEVNGP
jgi:hypothetical protein